jgi:hypothetical protein
MLRSLRIVYYAKQFDPDLLKPVTHQGCLAFRNKKRDRKLKANAEAVSPKDPAVSPKDPAVARSSLSLQRAMIAEVQQLELSNMEVEMDSNEEEDSDDEI